MLSTANLNLERPRDGQDSQDSNTATSEALQRLTLAISNAVFNRDFENPIILDNLTTNFRHRCDSRRPVTYSLEEYFEALRNWPIEFPHWGGTVLDVSLLGMDDLHGHPEIMVLQHVRGLQGPHSSLECSTVWKWRRTGGSNRAGSTWKAYASYSGHHPLPADFELTAGLNVNT